jgi:Ca2+/Na+ antiporter
MDSKHSMLPPRPGLALRAGITGHRPVPGRPFDPATIATALRDVFLTADAMLLSIGSRAYDYSSPRQFTLISALAAGADQLAVEAFSTLAQETHRTCRLEVVLPFGIDDYAATIEDPDDAKRMRELAKRANRLLILSDFETSSEEIPSRLEQYRQNRRYETVGRVIVHQADFVVAIWNGNPSEGVGGTADIVLNSVRNRVPVIWIDLSGETRIIPPGNMSGDEFDWIQKCSTPFSNDAFEKVLRPVLLPPHDITHDEGDEKYVSPYRLQDYLGKEQVPETSRWGVYHFLLASPARRMVQQIPRGNGTPRGIYGLWWDAKRSARLNTDHVRRYVEGEWRGYPFAERTAEQLRFARAWASADAVATGLGHAYRSTYVLVLLLSFLAVASGLTGVVFHEVKSWFVALELLILSYALYLYYSGKRKRLHERWLNTREVAEQLRASWALMLLGMGGRRTSRDGKKHWATWLTNAYLAEAGLPNLNADSEALRRIAEAALNGIAKDQSEYHTENAKVVYAIHHRLERIARRSLLSAIVNSSLLLVVLLITRHLYRIDDIPSLLERIILAMAAISAMLPALGATAAALRYQGDFERFGKRSHQTGTQLNEVSKALREYADSIDVTSAPVNAKVPRLERLLEILADLESGLISDLEDWRFVYVTRDVPEPG